MYDNIGSKIKNFATVLFIIMAIINIISGIALLMFVRKLWFVGLLIATVGVLLSWVGTCFLYGFGQLIENTDILVREAKKQSNSISNDEATEKVAQSIKNFKSSATASNPSSSVKRCPYCGERVTSSTCSFCERENNLF